PETRVAGGCAPLVVVGEEAACREPRIRVVLGGEIAGYVDEVCIDLDAVRVEAGQVGGDGDHAGGGAPLEEAEIAAGERKQHVHHGGIIGGFDRVECDAAHL